MLLSRELSTHPSLSLAILSKTGRGKKKIQKSGHVDGNSSDAYVFCYGGNITMASG